jgi:GGDEF domain-containing protein
MNAASVLRPRHGASTARSLEITALLRAAVVEGDETRIARLLSELLRVKGLTKGQRVALQMKALQNLLHALRSLALSDEVTGLHNRRGFVQAGTRLLDVALRDELPAHLIYLRLEQASLISEAIGRSVDDAFARQIGNLLRDLFPSYGVYEVIGRMSHSEFAALTTSPEYATRGAILMRLRRPQRNGELAAPPLSLGIAHYDPARPIAIDELLESARAALHAPERTAEPSLERVARMASSESAPQPETRLC